MKCPLCPKGRREKTEKGDDVDPRGKPHIHLMLVDKKGKTKWEMCYLDRNVPFKHFENFTTEFGVMIDRYSARKSKNK